MVIIDGKKIAAGIIKRLRRVTVAHSPVLAIVQIGHRPDSDIYIRQKIRTAASAGIITRQFHCQTRISQAAVVRLLTRLSSDRAIDGILLQLPVPSHLDTKRLIQAIDPKKDVDGFHPASTSVSPLIQAIEQCLQTSAKKSGLVVILGRDSIFTATLGKRLEQRGLTVHQFDGGKRIPSQTRQADIVITVRGHGPRLLPIHLKRGSVVIDAGIRRYEHGVRGDADPAIASVVSAYTPVPGGVGPLTVAFALRNIVRQKKPARSSARG